MSPDTFLISMGYAIAGDAELQAWCREVLGKELTVYVGADLENPPEVEEYPVCALLKCGSRRGENQTQRILALDLAVAVYDEEVKIDGNLRVYSGVPKVAALKHQVEGALLRSGLAVAVDFPEVDDLTPLFPIFVDYCLAECEILTTSRAALRR